jgi:hypothetical protein
MSKGCSACTPGGSLPNTPVFAGPVAAMFNTQQLRTARRPPQTPPDSSL